MADRHPADRSGWFWQPATIPARAAVPWRTY